MSHPKHKGRRKPRNGGNQEISEVVKSVSELALRINDSNEQRRCEFEWFKSHSELVTKRDLEEMEKRIMSKIGDWANRVEPKLDSIQTGLDELQKMVEDFQNSPGDLSPEDQAALDRIEAKTNALATDAGSIPAKPPA